MATSNFSKTGGVALLAATDQASNTITVGSAVDVSTYLAARIFVSWGRQSGVGHSYQTKFVLQASAKDSGDDEWFPVHEWTTARATESASSTTTYGFSTAGDATFQVNSVTGFSRGELCSTDDSAVEWIEIKNISGSGPFTITPYNNQTRSHNGSINFTNKAERFSWNESLVGIKRLRLIVDTASLGASGQPSRVQAWLMRLDSVQTS